MDEEGISNIYINDVMDKISRTFHGTFSIDNIPDIDNYAFSIIINLSKQKTKGSHFVAILNQKSNIIYFDSFGDQNINRTLQKYLKKYKKQVIYSNIQLQHIFSTHCGFFCMSFILCLENDIKFSNFLIFFNRKKLYSNDHICIDIIKFFINHMYLRNQLYVMD